MAENQDRDKEILEGKHDEGWVRQMAGVVLNCNPGEVDAALVEMWCKSLETARRQASESIGDIQVKYELTGKNQFHYKPYVGGKELSYRCDNQDIAILLALGRKYLGMNEDVRVAQFVGRILKIEDEWTK